MKKIGVTLCLLLIAYLTIGLQYSVLNGIHMYGVTANLLILFIVYLTSYTNRYIYYVIGIITAGVIDLVGAEVIGISVVSIIVTIMILQQAKSLLNSNRMWVYGIKIIIATIVFEFVYVLMRMGISRMSIDINQIVKIIAIETLFNMLIALAIFPLINYTGRKLEYIFKESNMLTRYF